MNTKNLTSFLFLAAAALLFFEILPIISELYDFRSEADRSLSHNIGQYIGITARILFHLGLSVYLFLKFWRHKVINQHPAE